MKTLSALVFTCCLVFSACGTTSPVAPSAGSDPLSSTIKVDANVDLEQRLETRKAATIKITQGTIVTTAAISGAITTITSVKGSHGFALAATFSQQGLVPGQSCRYVPECWPMTSLPLEGTWVGSDITGTVSYAGRTRRVGDDGAALDVQLASSVTLPAQAATATLLAPFTLRGVLTMADGATEVTGSGTATLELVWVELDGLPGSWLVTETRFEF